MATLREILGPEMDATATFERDETALHRAANHPDCNIDVVSQLLGMGAPVSDGNIIGQTPLHYFILGKCSLDIIRFVLDNGAFANERDNYNNSSLHYAMFDHAFDPDVVRLLFERGANIFEENANEEQPLHYAARMCNLDIINFLLESGANINALDSWYQSPLHYTLNSYECNLSVVELLLQKGADLSLKNDCGETPLHLAATHCDADIVKLLLEHGADVSSFDEIGHSCLYHAIFHRCIPEVVKTLLEWGPDLQPEYASDEPIFHFAVRNCNPNIVKLFLDHGASIDTLDSSNCSPLHAALHSTESDPDVIKLLVNKGASINLANNDGEQPLHLAAFRWDSSIVELLLDHGASVNVINSLAYTPLFNAVCRQDDDCSFAIQKLLLQSGALVYKGFSPLETVIDLLNKENVRTNAEKFTKILQWAELLLKYALLERPMLDFRKICVHSQTAVYLMNYGKRCLIELNSNYVSLRNSLAEFILQQRGKEHHDVKHILHVLSKQSCPIYKEVIRGLLTKRELKKKLDRQSEKIINKSTIKLNHDCVCTLTSYFCNQNDLLNFTLAFNGC